MNGTITETRKTAIGDVSITERDGRITSLAFGEVCGSSGSTVLDSAFTQLDEYLNGERESFELALDPEGTDFQRMVWAALTLIPYGETASYSEIARRIGHPNACRAVGNANNRNPIPIFIPCHRVIRSDGDIGGYASGQDLKMRLLRIEGIL